MCQAGHCSSEPWQQWQGILWDSQSYRLGKMNIYTGQNKSAVFNQLLTFCFQKAELKRDSPPEPPTIKPIMNRQTSAMKFRPCSLKVWVNFRSKYQKTELWFHMSDTISFQPSHAVAEKYFLFFVNCFDYEHHITSRDIWCSERSHSKATIKSLLRNKASHLFYIVFEIINWFMHYQSEN